MTGARSACPRVVIAGGSGFVGRALARRLSAAHEVVALSRSAAEGPGDQGISWRRADLFSLLDCERALEGCQVAVYLVHSMMPSARLTQARFEDMDLILADNFARAAAAAGVQRIVYLGGLVPSEGALSPHLASRVEVEKALAGHGVPVVALRASLVIGPHGSSFRILRNLVARLPVMGLPAWTRSDCQPIAVDDVVELLAACVGGEHLALGAAAGPLQIFDIGGPEILPYAGLISRTAEAMGLTRLLLPIPLMTPRLSTLWVSLITGTSRELVGPLVESLRHPMVCDDRRLQEAVGLDGAGLSEALAVALGPGPTDLPEVPRRPPTAARKPRNTVRSVQRMPLPEGRDATWVALEYLRWLPRDLRPFIGVTVDEEQCARFWLVGFARPLLALRYAPDRSTPDRALFYVVGGTLAATGAHHRGRLEFRVATAEGPDGVAEEAGPLGDDAGVPVVIAAIHDFVPALPWFVYNLTQAQAHLLVMHRFGLHLGRQPSRPVEAGAQAG